MSRGDQVRKRERGGGGGGGEGGRYLRDSRNLRLNQIESGVCSVVGRRDGGANSSICSRASSEKTSKGRGIARRTMGSMRQKRSEVEIGRRC